MIQEIKFRGISIDTWKWVYGYCVFDSKKESANIVHKLGNNEMQHTAVDPKTVSQFTGLYDTRKKEIYRGDILYERYKDEHEEKGYGEVYVEVSFKDGSFTWIGETTKEHHSFVNEPIHNKYHVIGNIYQNKELLGL